jgi:hypothetical protein
MMGSPERKISAVPPGRRTELDMRLASLEDEAAGLRAEVAALRDDIHWLSGAEEDADPGWLARGWVRASLLLATVGLVAIVSLPYLLNSDPTDPDPVPAAQAAQAPPTPAVRPRSAPAPVRATVSREPVPAPVRVRESRVPEPARVRAAEEAPVPAPRPRVAHERRAATPETDAPVRSENSP